MYDLLIQPFHQCEWLKYQKRRIAYVFQEYPDAKRAILIHDHTGDTLQDWILFCPGCGGNFLNETGTGLLGKPEMKDLLETIKRKE